MSRRPLAPVPVTRPSLYIDLVIKLREDAAAAITALRRAREGAEASAISASELRVWSGDDGRWWATPQVVGGWLAGYAGDYGAANEVEALCALIERARNDGREAGAWPALHLLDRAAHSADVVAVYREVLRDAVRDALETLVIAHETLDKVGEGWLSGDDVDAIAGAAGRAG